MVRKWNTVWKILFKSLWRGGRAKAKARKEYRTEGWLVLLCFYGRHMNSLYIQPIYIANTIYK